MPFGIQRIVSVAGVLCGRSGSIFGCVRAMLSALLGRAGTLGEGDDGVKDGGRVDEFERVQARLPEALAANVAGSGVDHVVVAMPSYSVGESLLSHYVARIPAMEHRYLNAQLLLNRIEQCTFVFVCSEAPTSEVVDYYRTLVPADVAERLRTRVRCIVVADRGARPLASKLLDRPDVLAELRDLIGARLAVIEPWNVTEDEVAVAVALEVPINGTSPRLRPTAFKSSGRRLFAAVGVPVPIGCEDVHRLDDVLAAIEHIRARRPDVRAVVVKHDDSGAGDGNTIVALRDADNEPLTIDGVREAIASLPDWYLTDLAVGGGVVEELVDGDGFSSPSVQFDMFPDGGVRVLATHDQLVGGANGQVYIGCRFPADPAYASRLARHGAAVAAELARRGATGRASADFVAYRDPTGAWQLRALEINLRKGGTTHPYAALRNLVPGHYDPDAGRWVTKHDGSARAYRSTDNVVDPAWTGRPPSSVIEAVRDAGLHFDPRRGTGVVLHMLACLAIDGRFGATAIGTNPAHADELFEAMLAAVST
jgi:PGM1 C-terminal domain